MTRTVATVSAALAAGAAAAASPQSRGTGGYEHVFLNMYVAVEPAPRNIT